MRRNWIKLYVDQILRGTMIDELENIERWSWIGLLLLAGDSPTEGTVCITNNIGYSDEQISELLDVPIEIFNKAKDKMIKFNKVEVDEKNVIKIVNWKKYQSEYKRQRKYRDSYNQKLQPKVTPKGNTLEGRRKKEEGRKEKKNIKSNSLCSEFKIPNDIDIELTQLLINKILENNPSSHIISGLTEKRRAAWIDDCRKLREIDKRSPEDIERIIVWCQEDNFWKANILSMSKLREKFDQLWLKGNETYKASQVGKDPKREESDKQKTFYEKRLKLKESLYKKYKPDFDQAVKEGHQDVVDDIENKIKTQLADFSQNYFGTVEK